jgi:uncharacterized protein YndB with AHSA1/START domain
VKKRNATAKSSRIAERAARDLVITRVFDAPRALVWKAWTEPEHFTRWWGPKGFTTPVCRIDLRVGGEYFNCMRSPEGQDFWSKGFFQEIVAPERLVMTDSFADDQGNIVPASHYGFRGDYPLEMLITVTFEEHDGKTMLTLKHVGLPAGRDRDMAGAGWNESFDKLAGELNRSKEKSP